MADMEILDIHIPCKGCGKLIPAGGENYCLTCRVWKLRLKEIEPKWIPVSERLPENNNQWVLCLCVGGAMEVLKFDYTMRNWDSQYPRRCYIESYVTHWMPLPKPPQENENGI